MRLDRFAVVLMVCALAGTASALAADEEKKSEEKKSTKPGALPRAAPKHDHKSPPAPESDMARMSRSPAPASGSMPKGAAPQGKLGTEPTARGKLGTDPKPDESSKPPPRLN